MTTQRLFIGIELNDTSRAACAAIAERLRASGLNGRFEVPEKLHITLAFLGDVPVERADDVERVMHEVAGERESFDLVLDKIGAFPHARSPRIVYIGTRDAGAAFRGLSFTLRYAYRDLGFGFKEDAVAHVTIARVKDEHRRPLPMLDVEPIPLRIDTISLFESLQGDTSTRYAVRSRAALRS